MESEKQDIVKAEERKESITKFQRSSPTPKVNPIVQKNIDFIKANHQKVNSYIQLNLKYNELKNKLIKNPVKEIDAVILRKYNIMLTYESLIKLKNNKMINDEVINYYLRILARKAFKSNRKNFFFSTFFFSQLIQVETFEEIENWVSKNTIKKYIKKYATNTKSSTEFQETLLSVFDFEKIFIPINFGLHWILIHINLKKKFICYYDSLASFNSNFMDIINRFFFLLAKKEKREIPKWNLYRCNFNLQKNAVDCGIFVCMNCKQLNTKDFANDVNYNSIIFRRFLFVRIVYNETSKENIKGLKKKIEELEDRIEKREKKKKEGGNGEENCNVENKEGKEVINEKCVSEKIERENNINNNEKEEKLNEIGDLKDNKKEFYCEEEKKQIKNDVQKGDNLKD